MLLPYAQCNLCEHIRCRQFGALSKENTVWFLKRFRALAKALKCIYDLTSGETQSTGLGLSASGLEF